MSSDNINIQTIQTILPHVQHHASPRSHLPTSLPLSFPSTLHHLNLHTLLHSVHHVLSHPSNSLYFFTTSTSPHNISLRGIMSLFLSSEPNWDSANFLSSTGLGKITRDMISEHFGIQVMFEKPHETLQGVTIGERSKEAQGVVDSIFGLFEELKEGLEGKYKCPGEIVQEVIKLAGEEGNDGMIFAKKFCHELVRLLPSLSESFLTSSVTALPSTPLRLLQDLSTTSMSLHLPPLSSLSDISPLPLPIPPLLALRILSPSSDLVSQLPEQTSILSLLHRDKSTKALHGFSGKADGTSKKDISLKGFTIPLEQITHLQSLSVEICQLIRDQARESGKEITLIDVVKFFDDLQIKMDKSGLGFRLIPSDS